MTAAGPLVLIILGCCAVAKQWRKPAQRAAPAPIEVTITFERQQAANSRGRPRGPKSRSSTRARPTKPIRG